MAKKLYEQFLEVDPSKLTQAQRNIFSRVEKQPPLKPYRDATKEELKGLQDSYKYIKDLLKESGSKITKNIPSLKQYTQEYEGTKKNARSDYIYELSKELKRLTNIYIRKAEKKAENMATDFSAYKLDYRKSISKFSEQVKSLTNFAEKVIKSEVDINPEHIFYGYEKISFETYNNLNELALNNLYYSMNQNNWDELITVFKVLPQETILRFWKDNRNNIDLSFTYKLGDLIGVDKQIMNDLWMYLNSSERAYIANLFYKNNFDILVDLIGRYNPNEKK